MKTTDSLVMILTLVFWVMVFAVMLYRANRRTKLSDDKQSNVYRFRSIDQRVKTSQEKGCPFDEDLYNPQCYDTAFDKKYFNLQRWVRMPGAPKEFVMSLFAEIAKDPESRKAGNMERLSVLEAEYLKREEATV